MKLPANHLADYIAEAASAIFTLENQIERIEAIGALIVKTLKRGNTLFSCGNGGSAAEALHLAEELTGKYRRVRRALPGICLNADSTAMTCIANDWHFDQVFARQIEALARKGDVLVLFSTSGNSKNCLAAAHAMHKAGGAVIGLLGKNGGRAKRLCDAALVVDSGVTAHVQEAHQVVLHLLLETIDAAFV